MGRFSTLPIVYYRLGKFVDLVSISREAPGEVRAATEATRSDSQNHWIVP